jgi:23S rRNA pseudouridine1911/1915/1917 synthase
VNQPRIIYHDPQLLALYKPSGWHTFSMSPEDKSLAGWLLERRPELAGVGGRLGPALAHRLDAPTSGLVLAGADEASFSYLRRLFQGGEIEKIYLALVEGLLTEEITIDLCLGARYRHSRKVTVAKGKHNLHWTRKAITQVYPLAVGHRATLCRVRILTGVRHQIRAHLAHTGHPIRGDTRYGAKEPLAEGRIMLHALSAQLVHPAGKGKITIGCPPDHGWVELAEDQGLAASLSTFLKDQQRRWTHSGR